MSEERVELVAGHDDRYYYPGKNGWPDYERGAVDPDTLEPIAGPSGPASDELIHRDDDGRLLGRCFSPAPLHLGSGPADGPSPGGRRP